MKQQFETHIAYYMCFLPSQISQLKPFTNATVYEDLKCIHPLNKDEPETVDINGSVYFIIPCGNLKHYTFKDVRALLKRINKLQSLPAHLKVDLAILKNYLNDDFINMIEELIAKKQGKVIKPNVNNEEYHHSRLEIERYFPLAHEYILNVSEFIHDHSLLNIVICTEDHPLQHVELSDDYIKILIKNHHLKKTRIASNNKSINLNCSVQHSVLYDVLSYAKQYRKTAVVFTSETHEEKILITGHSSQFVDAAIHLDYPLQFNYGSGDYPVLSNENIFAQLHYDYEKFHWIHINSTWRLYTYFQYIINNFQNKVDV
ncbi:hypothetical protein [Macrococcus armenti]|uniref:hypothetical protein n=1 Tax=Macrococcus armenti TaxID=2875764 RepID=UPI001CCC7938|nr:hypothetical protein [Macrococcus armenti]UBH13753.1 hypothetical protein LAU43_03425 [Macrococcus armenti]